MYTLIFWFSAVLFFACGSMGATEYFLGAAGKTYIRGAAAEAGIKYDRLLWGAKQSPGDWQFGLVQVQSSLATHGQFQAALSLYPISILELAYKRVWTQRYSASSVFSCGTNQCFGLLSRTEYRSRLALAHDSFSALFSYSMILTEARDTQEFIVDELENLLINPSGDIGNVRMSFVGYTLPKHEEYLVGLVYRQFAYLHSQTKNEMLSLALRSKKNRNDHTESWFMSVGQYSSTNSQPGLMLAAGISFSWGESLSLF